MSTWQTLSGGSGWALQLDGIIYRTGTAGGHMIIVENTSDFEFFSRTSKGAIQGYGYTFLSQNTYGPRLVRLVDVTNFSFHDLALVDSPAFHLIVDACTNGEVYNVIIRGANRGGLDGIDTWGTNLWYHDIEVTNKDECVTIKNPSTYTLVENIYCNWSGGCAMGSLGTGTAISNIKYNNVYTWQSNQMYMIKSNGGSGYIKDCTFTNFIGHSNAYGLDVNEYWTDETLASGSGISISGLTFSNWQGTVVDPKRAPIQILCADAAPCTGISLSNIDMWTDTNAAMHYVCESAYGSGYCLKSGSGSSYTSTTTVSAAPTGYNGAKMADDLAAGLGLSVSIAIPTIPTTFYPGVPAISALLNGNGAGAGSSGGSGATTLLTSTKVVTSATSTATGSGSGSGGSCSAAYAQCGGTSWAGATCCVSGSTCKLHPILQPKILIPNLQVPIAVHTILNVYLLKCISINNTLHKHEEWRPLAPQCVDYWAGFCQLVIGYFNPFFCKNAGADS
jgi:rhamnogalacturonan hydrolase